MNDILIEKIDGKILIKVIWMNGPAIGSAKYFYPKTLGLDGYEQ